jgi:hypothetical protein
VPAEKMPSWNSSVAIVAAMIVAASRATAIAEGAASSVAATRPTVSRTHASSEPAVKWRR